MKLYDLEMKAQDNIIQEPITSTPVFGGNFKNKFSGLKV